jgi:tetratricopeptide (TPR) repeat protein/nitrate/TMAO reductase-like tetraheme cytochrome c subunit
MLSRQSVSEVRRRMIICSVMFVAICGYGVASQYIDGPRKTYATRVAETYSYRFGPGEPFLPSNAQIEGGTFIQAGAFPTAQYCRGCHESAYHQWRQSLHANSFRTPFYTKNVGLLQNTKGMEFSRHCEGCHNPIELFSGLVTPRPASTDREFDQDGVTCMVCHSIAKLQPTYGLGSYVMGVPAVMVDEHGNRIPGEVDYAEIMDHVDRHKAAVMKDFYRTPEYCAACHKANIPKSLDDYKWLRAIGLYDEWQRSSYAKQSPLPFYQKNHQTCQSCHMPREAALQDDAAAVNGTIVSHRWIGGNTAVPFLYRYDEQLKKTIDYLKADKLNVDLFALSRPGSPEWIAPLGATTFTLRPGDELQVLVVIQNKGIGHTLLPEQRDIYQAWVEFDLTDAAGRILESSGQLDSESHLDPGAHAFVTRLLDNRNRLLNRHEIWDRRAIASDATIQAGRSAIVRYDFQLPKSGIGPYYITAKVNYRHFNEQFTEFVLGADHPSYPVVEMATRTRELRIGTNLPTSPGTNDNPTWMRWNNFGIALLDATQYAQATKAFSQVLQLKPDYGDAYTNLGIVYLQWERYEDASASLRQALARMPQDPRALYYRALVERNQGDLEASIADLQQIAKLFPRSGDTHRELGFCYEQQNKDALARIEYETLQSIDPDDLSAHYNLAILYSRDGDLKRAAVQRAFFADKNNDALSSNRAWDFLRLHPELLREQQPWHVHQATSK